MERRPLVIPDKPKRIRRRQLAIFTPDWEHGTYRKWAEWFVIKNHWRVQHIFADHDECMAQVALIFAVCFRKYYGKVTNPAHFMSLFKTAVTRKWNTYARDDEKYRDMIDDSIEVANLLHPNKKPISRVPAEKTHRQIEPFEDALGPLATAVAQLPSETLLAFRRLLEAPAEVIEFIFRPAPPGRNGVPTPDPVLWDKSIDKLIRRLFRIPYPQKGQAHDIVERLRDLRDVS